jgi:hypothetical protein
MGSHGETLALNQLGPESIELHQPRGDSDNEQQLGGLTEPPPPSDRLVNVATVEPVPPDGGYGWVCTFAVLLINAHTWGVNAVREPPDFPMPQRANETPCFRLT